MYQLIKNILLNPKKNIQDLISNNRSLRKCYIFQETPHFSNKITKKGVMELINTVLGYKKGSKTKNIFSHLESMTSHLFNALSVVSISLKLADILHIELWSVAPAKGHSAS